MRVSSQLLRSRAARPLHGVEYLDLSHSDLVSVDKLELCPKLQCLILRDNRIEAVPDIDCCPQLWRIDLANNRLRSLEGLSRFAAFGCLILSNNELEWDELQKIRHIHILDLALHGNPKLEMDAYYRMHVIDSLPLIWMLDGRIITSAERAQVRQFFKDSAYSDRPVRRKLPRKQFVPSTIKNITVTGVHGNRTDHMMRRFPQKASHNIDLDKRRLHYLGYNLQQDVNLEMKHTTREKFKSSDLIVNLITCRTDDQERCNMLLLLLVASLEFAIPSAIVQQTLEVARLNKIESIETMDVFMFSREIRCRIVSLLLGAVKIERDQSIDGGLYNRLYLGLYDLVSDLIRLANGDDITIYQAMRKKFDSRKSGYRSLLASEVVQLLCIVPSFFNFIGRDPGIMDLLSVGTKDTNVGEQLKALSWQIQSAGGGMNRVYQEIGQFLLHKTKEANAQSLNPAKTEKMSESLNSQYLSYCVEPSYIITSKRLVQVPDRPHSSAMTTGNATRGSDDTVTAPRTRARAATALGVRTKRSVRMRSRAKTATRRPALSDRVEIGHQTYGRLVALPETHVGLVQLDSLAAPRFQQADVNLKGDDLEGQFHYVNFKNMEWDTKMGRWKRSKEFYDYQAYNLGDHRASTSSESEVRFLSEALQKSLQLQARVPPAPIAREPSPANSKPQGRTLINNHVRSIVRECLKEAEIQWPESDLLEETPERAWEEPERTETPGVQSEVTANLDWESFTASRDAEEDHIEQSEDVEEEYGATHASPYLESTWEWSVQPHSPPTDPNNDQTSPSPELGYCPDNTQGLLEPGFYENTQDHGSRSDIHLPPSLYEPALLISSHMDLNGNEFGVHKSGSYPYVSRPASRGDGVELEEMVTMTENARLDAWRSSEAMKIASSSGVPSRVGSATSRARQQPPPPPPQRPASPSHSGPVPVKTADRWLARGKNVNAMCLRRVEKPLPGWMEGLQAHRRRPQSSPSVRRPMSSVSTRSGISSHDPGNPGVRRARGAAAVYVSGRSPPTYTRIQSARVTLRRR